MQLIVVWDVADLASVDGNSVGQHAWGRDLD